MHNSPVRRRPSSAVRVAVAIIAGFILAATAGTTVASANQTVAQTAATTVSTGVVKAADLSQFRPGNIITDGVFFDSSTMSEAQIQQFLEGKVPNCRSGYTCLKDWYDTSRATSADAMCGAYNGGSRERASTIIYKVAKACGINPQVILTTLEKEQGLVTHVWPSEWRYTSAMGQGCPDTAACDSKYYGFFNQVFGAAWQFKRYANPPGTSQFFTWYAPGKTWNILYNPNRDCGSSPVYVENQATANLYYYTPYQPNAASLRAGYGEGDGCSTYGNRNFYQRFVDWFGSTQVPSAERSPFGNLELVESRPGAVRVVGWAIDPDTADPLAVHVYVNGKGTAITARGNRPDVGAAYPSSGAGHGYDAEVPVSTPGAADVCVFAINVGTGGNTTLGCRTVTAYTGPPVGRVDEVTLSASNVRVRGWALDPDIAAPARVRVDIDGVLTELAADQSRPDIAASFPLHGAGHGFDTVVPIPAAAQSMCVTALNTGPGSSTTLLCRSIMRPAGSDLGRSPVGYLESVDVGGDSALVKGWTLDPDTSAPIKVHVYVNSNGREYTANESRPDVGVAYPAYGDSHGYLIRVSLPPGNSNVCAYAINTRGENVTLGCRSVQMKDTGRPPIGNFESVAVTGTTATVRGWSLDPDTASPVQVQITAGERVVTATADTRRDDVGAAYPGYGPAHGYTAAIDVPLGRSVVCVKAINSSGPDVDLGCRDAVTADRGVSPIGNFESAEVRGGVATLVGWAIDPDTAESIDVHAYVDGTGQAFTARVERPDVGAAYPAYGPKHGFSIEVKVPNGRSRVCVYAINTKGPNPALGCRAVDSLGGAPIGNLETVQATPGGIDVVGWAIDPDVTRSIPVHIYVDGTGFAHTADVPRPDVAAAYPGYGSGHGYSVHIGASPGSHTVCVYAIDDPPSLHTSLGCQTVDVT